MGLMQHADLGDIIMTSAQFFGYFEWHPEDRKLFKQGVPVPLGERTLHLLSILVAQHDRQVSSSDLLQIVWAGKPVESSNLTAIITRLRKLFGGDAIASGKGGGYRFMMPVSKVQGSPTAP